MATGDATITKIGVFADTTIAAGATGQNLKNAYLSGSKFFFVPMNNGQVMVLKQVVEGW